MGLRSAVSKGARACLTRVVGVHTQTRSRGVEPSILQAATVISPLSPILKTLGKMTLGLLKLMCGMPCLGAFWSIVVQIKTPWVYNPMKRARTDDVFA